jgi:chorismate mutase/prephenate dehydratase
MKRPRNARNTKTDLDTIRTQIDRVDKSLVSLLNERAKLVVRIGKAKRASGVPIYAPHRESQVLSKVIGMSKGPLPDRSVEAVYREIMSGSFALEQPLRIGYLGPEGSHSHVAAARHFGSSVEFDDLQSVEGVFSEVARGHVDYGLVPIENSIHGGVAETLDAFMACAGRVHVYAEAQLEVHHALAANCAPRQVRRIYSKPEVFSQCRNWLATQYPGIELVATASSSFAMRMITEESAAKSGRKGSAAIGTTLAADLYGVNVLFKGIEDHPHNITRFHVISRQQAERSGHDKTSILFSTLNKPGALASVLSDFHRAGVNLTHIDKRPGGRTNWQYTFFIDAEGHQEDAPMKRAIALAKRHCRDLAVLGSYPRSRRIL